MCAKIVFTAEQREFAEKVIRHYDGADVPNEYDIEKYVMDQGALARDFDNIMRLVLFEVSHTLAVCDRGSHTAENFFPFGGFGLEECPMGRIEEVVAQVESVNRREITLAKRLIAEGVIDAEMNERNGAFALERIRVTDKAKLKERLDRAKAEHDRQVSRAVAGVGNEEDLNQAREAYELLQRIDVGRMTIQLDWMERNRVGGPAPAPAPAEPAKEPTGSTVSVTIDADAIQQAVVEKAVAQVREIIDRDYGPVVKPVVFQLPAGCTMPEQLVHEKFDEVLMFIQADEPVFMVGPAGSGKNELAQAVAQTMGLDFYFTNCVTQEYKLTGFTDALGNFQESQFYKAFRNGGLFFLDEVDASIPEVLVVLDAALANGYFDFPAPIGRVDAHPDFRVIAAGNTWGNGASIQYVGRNQLDGATLDRFSFVEVGYDPRIEEAVAQGRTDLLTLAREIRKGASRAGVPLIVSYRAIRRIVKMAEALGLERAIESCILKGMGREDRRMIWTSMQVGALTEEVRQACQRVMA